MREECVLLRLVPAMDLINEQDGLPAETLELLRPAERVAEFLEPAAGCGELHEVRARRVRDDPRERRLAAPGRTPEDHGRHPILHNGRAEECAGADELLLPDERIERRRADTLGERSGWSGGAAERDHSGSIVARAAAPIEQPCSHQRNDPSWMGRVETTTGRRRAATACSPGGFRG